MSNGLQVISSRLLISYVGVQTSVSGCACEVLALSEWNVFSFWVLVALRETKVYDEHTVLVVLHASDQKVIRLDVSVDDPLFVHLLDSLDHLSSNLENSFEVKLSFAFLKQIFQAFSQQIHHHDMELFTIFCFLVSHEVKVWHLCFSSEFVDQLAFPEQHDVFLVLHCFFLLSSDVRTYLSQSISKKLLTTLAAKISPVFLFSTMEIWWELRKLTFIDFTESTPSKLLDDFVPFFKYFLILNEHF